MENIKSIKGLLKLQNWKVDEKRREVGMWESKRAKCIDYIEQLDRQVAAEKEAFDNTVVGADFGTFLKGVKKRQEDTWKKIEKIDQEIDALKDQLAELFQELKQYEIVLEQRLKRLSDEEKKREQEFLDEIGLNLHLRK